MQKMAPSNVPILRMFFIVFESLFVLVVFGFVVLLFLVGGQRDLIYLETKVPEHVSNHTLRQSDAAVSNRVVTSFYATAFSSVIAIKVMCLCRRCQAH